MTKIKICGVQTVEDILYADAYGASYVGFVFAKSPRQLSLKQAQALASIVPKHISIVGVIVSPSPTLLAKIETQVPLDFWQIHGSMPNYTSSLPKITARSLDTLESNHYPSLLLDAKHSGQGKPFDWSKIEPSRLNTDELWIAGGLDASNVKQAIHYFHPAVVDVSSGVETNYKKDPKKIRAFCKAVKEEYYVQSTK
ncbi:phosphoribosylanthranilate isomerase [Enterococcus bulliens]